MGMSPGARLALGMGTTGALAGGAYYAGQRKGEQNKKTQRNMAFGTGLAGGLAAPHIMNQLGSYINTLQNPNQY